MKDIVTFETAVRLKEAGFPQPAPEVGQVWHYDRQTFLIITFVYSTGQIDFATIGGTTKSLVDLPEHCVFAPTATDILRELDDLFFIRKSMYESKPIFSVFDEKRAENGLNVALSIDYNPAEAASEAWLKLKDEL